MFAKGASLCLPFPAPRPRLRPRLNLINTRRDMSSRIDLNCSFAEKDRARALGAQWDPARRKWYINQSQVYSVPNEKPVCTFACAPECVCVFLKLLGP